MDEIQPAQPTRPAQPAQPERIAAAVDPDPDPTPAARSAADPNRVCLVLPCKDEAEALPAVIAATPQWWQVLVVDNGSVDDTAEVARRLGADVVTETQPGYGAAVMRGLYSTTAGIVVVCDADGSVAPNALSDWVPAIAAGQVDLVCGRRRPEPGSWPRHARWANALLARLVTTGTGSRLHDIAPYRIARRHDLLSLPLADLRFGHPLEVLLRASRAGWRIVEQDINYGPRQGGESKVTGSLRGTLRAGTDFLKVLLGSPSVEVVSR